MECKDYGRALFYCVISYGNHIIILWLNFFHIIFVVMNFSLNDLEIAIIGELLSCHSPFSFVLRRYSTNTLDRFYFRISSYYNKLPINLLQTRVLRSYTLMEFYTLSLDRVFSCFYTLSI